MAESPKHFFKHILERGPYYEVLKLLEQNPNWTVIGSVDSDRGHYVHWNSTDVSLQVEGYLGDGESDPESEADLAASAAVDKLQEVLKEQVIDWNKQLEKALYASLESQQSDETLIDWMNNNGEWRFDEDGEQVDLTDYMPVDNLKPGIRDRVLREYADLFDRTPEQVYQALMQRDYRFDKRGNRVDVTQFKKIDELDEATRKRILDKHRDFLTQDNDWATWVEDDWKDKLEKFGFERVEIRYSLGYSQGDGASFTCDSIDVKKLCEAMLTQQKTEAEAKTLAASLIE